MKELKIKYDFSHGPIWKDKYDINTGEWSTGIDIIDNDLTLSLLNDEAEKKFSSFYHFDKDGSLYFDAQSYELSKPYLLSLLEKIITRINDLNDGSFTVKDEETPKLIA